MVVMCPNFSKTRRKSSNEIALVFVNPTYKLLVTTDGSRKGSSRCLFGKAANVEDLLDNDIKVSSSLFVFHNYYMKKFNLPRVQNQE